MTSDNKNMLLAIALSVIVLVGWNYFYAVPEAQRARQQAQTQQQAQPNGTPQAPGSVPAGSSVLPQPSGAEAVTAPGTAPAPAAQTREAALAASPRVVIDTPKIAGSLSLKGGRIDDIALKGYRETVDPRSPNIILFSPSGGPNAYFAEFGWVAGAPGTALPTADTVWTADRDRLTAQAPVTLTWSNGQGLTFRRQIAVDDTAMFTVTDSVENTSGNPASLFHYGRVFREGKPVTQGYYILHEGLIGVLGDKGLQEITYDTLDKEAEPAGNGRAKAWRGVTGGFLGITDKYWAAALVPDQTMPFDGRFSTNSGNGPRFYQADMLGQAQPLAAGATVQSTTRLFAGAKEVSAIDAYKDAYNIKNFDLMIDWGWFYFITKPMFWLIDHSYKLVGNFGIAILVVTVIIKTLFFPLANKSYASMAKMKAVQPEMLAIRDRYADDKVKQQQELMALYKREKINPVAGCWPVLLQIPVFFALYKVLFITIEMRHAPFYGWIRDLAAPDPTSIFNLFGLLPFAVPAFLLIGVWPILMGITMFVQMKMNPEPTDPVQKTMFTWMPIVFTFMLASFPAGLVIYWTWNNLLSIAQQWFIMKKNGVKVELFDNLKGMFGGKAGA